jgi:GIY-YIG catalytic domain-containing protein
MRVLVLIATGWRMSNDAVIAAALGSLAGARHGYNDAVQVVPDEPGLYAFYGDRAAWSSLGLTPAFDDQPLYVGKAERSLSGRDVRTHFAAGKTGSSTVRRSLAALLEGELALVPIPRNIAKPDGSANFALDPPSEARLSDWMQQRLSLATWVKLEGESLDVIETVVVRQLRPPLNLDKVGEPRERLRAARKRLADVARAWQPSATKHDVDRSTSAPLS